MPNKDLALVIQIGKRFFYRFGNRGQVLTAWSLAGAKLFGWPSGLNNFTADVEKKLKAKGIEYVIETVMVVRD